MTRFIAGVKYIPELTLYGPEDIDQRCGVVSFNIARMIPSEVGTMLEQDYGILSRVRLHCSPGAHQSLGTFPTGTVRFGFGYFNTTEEIDIALDALNAIATWATQQETRKETSNA